MMKFVLLAHKKIKPTKIVCIGRNYAAHIEELNNATPDQPVIFIKPNSALSDQILISDKDEIHYEGEISFLIKSGKISALAFGLDLTKRDIQSTLKAKGLPWERAKAFDNSAVFSEFVAFDATANSEHKVENLRLELWINGELKQQGGYDLMLFKPDEIIDEVSSFLTLEDNDIIMTGTPAGVGKLIEGDVFEAKVFTKNKLIISQEWKVTMLKTGKKVGGAK